MNKILDYLHNTYGISKDGIVATLITIFTFFVAYLFKIIYSFYKTYQKNKDLKEIILISIKELSNKIDQQLISYDKLVIQLNVDNKDPYNFEQVAFPFVDILKQIGFRKAYKAFFSGIKIPFVSNKEKLTSFINFWETVDYFDTFHKDSWKKGLDFIEALNKNEAFRNKSILSSQTLIDSFMITVYDRPVQPVQAQYIHDLDAILYNLAQIPNFNSPTNMNEHYVIKILELNRRSRDALKTLVNVINAAEVNRHLLEADIHYKNEKNIVFQNSENFKHLIIGYKKSREKLNSFINVCY